MGSIGKVPSGINGTAYVYDGTDIWRVDSVTEFCYVQKLGFRALEDLPVPGVELEMLLRQCPQLVRYDYTNALLILLTRRYHGLWDEVSR